VGFHDAPADGGRYESLNRRMREMYAPNLPVDVEYCEGWDPSSTPVGERHTEEFLQHIAAAFRGDAAIYP
jgi:hypothetical protein